MTKLTNKITVKQLMVISLILAFSNVIINLMGIKQTAYPGDVISQISSLGTTTLLSIGTFIIIIILLGIALLKKN